MTAAIAAVTAALVGYLGLLGVGLAAAWAVCAAGSAFALLVLACDKAGFVGFALYVILWVVATPIMVALCLIGGVVWAVGLMAPTRSDA